jgi:hypothetical protein
MSCIFKEIVTINCPSNRKNKILEQNLFLVGKWSRVLDTRLEDLAQSSGGFTQVLR